MTSQASRIRDAIKGFGAATSTQIIDALNDPGINKNVLQKRLVAMKDRGEVAVGVENGQTVYSLLDGYKPLRRGVDREVPAVPMAGIAADELTPIRDIAPVESSISVSLPKALLQHQDELGLLARAEAVASDIEDLIGDACDRQLDHELIKALTIASGAMHRAAHRLVQA